jgi:hypothetical protein
MNDYIARHAAQLDRDLKDAIARTAPNPQRAEMLEQAEGIAEYLDRGHDEAVDVGPVTAGDDVAVFRYDLVGMGSEIPAFEVVIRRI